MLKEIEPPKETASELAKRKWRNSQLRKQIIEKRQAPRLVTADDDPEIAETIINDHPRASTVERFQSQFIKEMRAIFDEHKERNLELYRQWLQHRMVVLLAAKLKRLQAEQQAQEVGK